MYLQARVFVIPAVWLYIQQCHLSLYKSIGSLYKQFKAVTYERNNLSYENTSQSKFFGVCIKFFVNISICKISSATTFQKQPQDTLIFTFIKNCPAFNHIFNQVLIKPSQLCINTLACLKINQYSTGLFVSYSTHRKTQLYKNFTNILSVKVGQILRL